MSQKMDNLLHVKNAPNGTAPVKETRTKKILGLRFFVLARCERNQYAL